MKMLLTGMKKNWKEFRKRNKKLKYIWKKGKRRVIAR